MKSFLSAILFFAFAFTVSAQDISADKVPAVVMTAFKTKFPAAENPKWELKKDLSYKVNFTLTKLESKAEFGADGKWQKTETKLDIKALPTVLTNIVNTSYKGFTVDKASKHESSDKDSYYELKVENSTMKVTAKYSLTGSLLSKSEKTKDTTN